MERGLFGNCLVSNIWKLKQRKIDEMPCVLEWDSGIVSLVKHWSIEKQGTDMMRNYQTTAALCVGVLVA